MEQRRKKQEQLNGKSSSENKPKKSTISNGSASKPTATNKTKVAPIVQKKGLLKENDLKKPLNSNKKPSLDATKTFKKPQLSYDEMIKLAQKLNEEKLRSSSLVNIQKSGTTSVKSVTPMKNDSSKPSINPTFSNRNASTVSSTQSNGKKYLPGDIRYKNDPSMSNSKPEVAEKSTNMVLKKSQEKTTEIGKTTKSIFITIKCLYWYTFLL